MTRQNKIALVVGFALILLAGVLISDHLSAARMEVEAATATPTLPATEPGRGVPAAADTGSGLVDLSALFRRDDVHRDPIEGPIGNIGGPANPGPAGRSGPGGSPLPGPDSTAVTGGAPAEVLAPGGSAGTGSPSPPPAPGSRSAPASEPQAVTHRVAPGESLTSICRRYYGDPALVGMLATANGLADPDHLTVSMVLRIPAVQTEGHSAGGPAPRRDQPPLYTIRPGETLSGVAQKLLRSARRWEEIYELNRGVIDDPDDVAAGTVIRLPVGGGAR
jgi:nucleoid-associated protein YgaU